MSLSRFERWYLRRIFRREVLQGPEHFDNTTELYRMIRKAWAREFWEDNLATVDECLQECFDGATVPLPNAAYTPTKPSQ